MKILFSGLIISMFSINLYASGFTPECQKAFEKLCPPKSSDADAKCLEKNMEKLPPECKKSLSSMSHGPCADFAVENKCKNKKDDELVKCMQEKGMADEIMKQLQKKAVRIAKSLLKLK